MKKSPSKAAAPAAAEQPRPGPRPLALGLAAAVFSLATSLLLAWPNFRHPYAVKEGRYSDHFSHMCSAVLFYAKGLDIYRRPVQDNLDFSRQPQDLSFARSNAVTADMLFVNPIDPSRPPLVINWAHQIRPYPPGVYLLFAPLALPYHYGRLGFAAANKLSIAALDLIAALASFLLFAWALSDSPGWPRAARLITAVLSSCWLHFWALRGFYDLLPLVLVLLSLWALDRKSWLDAFFFFSAAAFFHFRALYFLPVALLALPRASPSWLKEPKLWLSLALAGTSAVCFLVALPELEAFQGNNPLYHFYGRLSFLTASDWLTLLLGAAVAVLMVRARDLPAFMFLGCYGLFLVLTPQTYPWHTLFAVPLVVHCSRRAASPLQRAEWLGTLALVLWLGVSVYGISGLTLTY